MKTKLFYSTIVILGVFLMIDTSLLAQSTGTSTSRSASRARTTTRVVPAAPAVPDIEALEYVEFDHGFAYTTSSADKNSKLSLSKKYEGATTSKKGTFQVADDIKKIRISISGRVESGEIEVELYMPGEKEVGTFKIDETADVTWSQSINIDEEETKYFGEWTFVIHAKEAHGSYHLSLSTY